MAVHKLAPSTRPANPTTFNTALAAFRRADRRVTSQPTRSARAAYSRTIDRLLAIPAPDVRALAAKMEVADLFDLDQYEIVLGDARRLAGL